MFQLNYVILINVYIVEKTKTSFPLSDSRFPILPVVSIASYSKFKTQPVYSFSFPYCFFQF